MKHFPLFSLLSGSRLQALLTSGFNGQSEHSKERSEEERTGSVDGRGRVGRAGIDGDNGSTETSEAVEEAGDTGARATVGGREDLGGVGVEYTVHDVLEESLEGREGELEARLGGDGEDVDKDTGDDRGDGHGSLAADELDVDGVAGEEGTGDTDGGGNGIVAVLGGFGDVFTAEVLGQEGVEERVAHTDASPNNPEKASGGGEPPAAEERTNAVARELLQVTLDDIGSRKLLLGNLRVAANLVEDVLGEPGLGSVVVSDAVDDSDGLGLPATRQKELGRLEEVEEEKAGDEHAKGDAADDIDEVPPSNVGRVVNDASPCNCKLLAKLLPRAKFGGDVPSEEMS